MKGILYGVGVGPGDKKMLTIQAVEVLKESQVIFVPNMGGENTALKIVEDYVTHIEKVFVDLPMTRDEKVLLERHTKCADIICEKLDKGLKCSFITLGDPTVYSTYMYIHRIILKRGYEVKIINGITSFCASAARLNISLCDKDEALHIVPASYGDTKEMLMLKGNKVLMKSGKSIKDVKETLKELDMLKNAKMVECCCMENEKLYENFEDVNGENSYFSVIIIKGE